MSYFEESEEIKAIPFEWTPKLMKIATSEGSINPSIGLIEETVCAIYFYHPDMVLQILQIRKGV